jgi:hypothetical protein
MDSDAFIPDDENDEESLVLTEPLPHNSLTNTLRPSNSSKIPIWHEDYKLDDSDSPIYLIANSLIRRSLLSPPTTGQQRFVRVECTQ